MKLSDAIKELQNAIDKHGDIELYNGINGKLSDTDELGVYARRDDKGIKVAVFE